GRLIGDDLMEGFPNNLPTRIGYRITSGETERGVAGPRIRAAFARLGGEGRRRTRHAPIGFRWKKRKDGKCYAEPDPQEQALCIRASELRDERLSYDEIRQAFVYELKASSRDGREYGPGEIRHMAEVGDLMRAALAESEAAVSA